MTVYGGQISRYAYLDASDPEPLGPRVSADVGGKLASGITQWMVEHPGLPLDPDERRLVELAQYFAPLNRGWRPCDATHIVEEEREALSKFGLPNDGKPIDYIMKLTNSYWSCK